MNKDQNPNNHFVGFSRLTSLLVFTWACIATVMLSISEISDKHSVWMGLSKEERHFNNRKALRYDILVCQSDVWRAVKIAGETKSGESFGMRLDGLLNERTSQFPKGRSDVFHVWISQRLEDWIEPPFAGRTNLVLVSLNAERYGENFQWWSNGVLYATADSDCSRLGLTDTNRWKSSICYSQRGDGAIWWRRSKEGVDRNLEKCGWWDLPNP